jgi:drug/metabolite transporter (DMT)-like permease
MTLQTALGVGCGLAAAICHSFSYLFSRHAVSGSPREAIDRFVGSHLIMGLLAIPFLPIALHGPLPAPTTLALALAWTAGFYLIGQGCFFVLNRYASPSLASPLLGIKILVVAALAVLVLHRPVPALQWVAGGIAVVAIYTLNRSAEHLPVRALGWLVAACCGYAISDTGIAHLMEILKGMSPLRAGLIGVCMTYSAIGVLALGTRIVRRTPIQRPHPSTLGFAIFWMGAMVFLFVAIALVGPVTAVILQATRGLFSFALAHTLPKMGIGSGEEQHAPPSKLRLAGALMMVLAAALAAAASPHS